MTTLWIFSDKPNFYSAPQDVFLMDDAGESVPHAKQYATTNERNCHSCSNTCVPLQQGTEILVLVAGTELFNLKQLQTASDSMVKLAIVLDHASLAVRKQLDSLHLDGCLFGVVTEEAFMQTVARLHAPKKALFLAKEDVAKFTSLDFTSMASAAEMGVVTLFYEQTQTIMDMPNLTQKVFGCLSDLSIECVVQFVFEDKQSVYPENANVIYKDLLGLAKTTNSRIVSVGRFLMFCFTHVQILIINAPCNDVDRYGRLRDIAAHIVSIAESRLKTIRFNELLKVQQQNSNHLMDLFKMVSTDSQLTVKTIMTELSLGLREMTSGFDLNLAQEKALLYLAENALDSLENLHQKRLTLEQHFHVLLQPFDGMMDQLDSASSLLSSDTTAVPVSGSTVERF